MASPWWEGSKTVLRRLLLLCAVVFAACPGLPLDAGNAFPCDFSQPPSERDKACVAGDVCGIDNRCGKYLYEGPRFEGAPSLISTDGGFRLHPQRLTGRVTLLAQDLLGNRLLVRQAGAGTLAVNTKGLVFPAPDVDTDFAQFTALTIPGTGLGGGVGLTRTGQVRAQVALPMGAVTRDLREKDVALGTLQVKALRVQPATMSVLQPALKRPPLIQYIGLDGTAHYVASVVDAGLGGLGPRDPIVVDAPRYPLDLDAGAALDVIRVDRQGAPPSAVVLQAGGLALEQPDGGFTLVAGHDAATAGALRLNLSSTVLAATRRTPRGDVLSTWLVGTEAGGQALQQAWPDCTPCRADNGLALAELLEVAAPLRSADGLGVEVVCLDRARNTRSLLRVTGSVGIEPTDRCVTASLPLPFDVSRLAADDGVPVASAGQRGLDLGGLDGQVWRGETPSSLLPIALERVPRHVTTVRTVTSSTEVARPQLAAITDTYLASLQPALGNQLQNGFRRVVVNEDFGNAADVLPAAAIHGVSGWSVLTSGVVVRTTLDARELDRDAGVGASPIEFGPRLVTPAGDPIRGTIGGEAWVESDGGVTSFFVAADDGLYFVPSPPGTLSTVPTGSSTMTPQLQPEPSVPIRSFALERTPLGTDGKTRARGYLVTSRNAFEWSLGGTPARWSATPLVLAGGEPSEVWFDKPRSALGRVGYTNGQIYSLPGGYQLSEALPAASDGVVVRVLDYENLGGWPVALATTGLFKADWPLVDGKLQNKFDDGRPNKPMAWSRLTLPDGSEPWLEADGTVHAGKLYVTMETQLDGKQFFTLFVFLDHGVWVVATHLRKP